MALSSSPPNSGLAITSHLPCKDKNGKTIMTVAEPRIILRHLIEARHPRPRLLDVEQDLLNLHREKLVEFICINTQMKSRAGFWDIRSHSDWLEAVTELGYYWNGVQGCIKKQRPEDTKRVQAWLLEFKAICNKAFEYSTTETDNRYWQGSVGNALTVTFVNLAPAIQRFV